MGQITQPQWLLRLGLLAIQVLISSNVTISGLKPLYIKNFVIDKAGQGYKFKDVGAIGPNF